MINKKIVFKYENKLKMKKKTYVIYIYIYIYIIWNRLYNYFLLKINKNKDATYWSSNAHYELVVHGSNPLFATYRNKDDFCF